MYIENYFVTEWQTDNAQPELRGVERWNLAFKFLGECGEALKEDFPYFYGNEKIREMSNIL